VKAAEVSEIPTGRKKVVTIQGKEILIVNVNGTYYAIGNRCPHEGVDLSKGSLEGNVITCPAHGAKFDVTTGKVVYRPKYWVYTLKVGDVPSYEVKVDGNNIMLGL
jgi:nitrite reductase/ring-hydroxylating ferredoxin subunit